MVLTLSDEKIGTPSTPQDWSNKERKNVPIPYKEDFIKSAQRAVVGYGREGLRLY
jgi:hypothetical protein